MAQSEARFIAETEKFMGKNISKELRGLGARRGEILSRKKTLSIDTDEMKFIASEKAAEFKARVDAELTKHINRLEQSGVEKVFNAEKEAAEFISKLKKKRFIAGASTAVASYLASKTLRNYAVHRFKYWLTGLVQ